MRHRKRILGNLEDVYREAFTEAERSEDPTRMARLDFDFQRDQLMLEAILDVRDLLAQAPAAESDEGGASLLEKAQALRNLTRLR